jgi:hypothetical protein
MSATFDYITGKKSGREAELEASLEHMGGHLGIEIEDNEKLRAEIERLTAENAELKRADASMVVIFNERADVVSRLTAENGKLLTGLRRIKSLEEKNVPKYAQQIATETLSAHEQKVRE